MPDFGYQNEAAAAKPVHEAPGAAAAPPPGGKQLNATETPDLSGPGTALVGRVKQFAKGAVSSRPGAEPLGGMGEAGGGAAEGAAAGAAEELAPLALAL